MMTKRSDTPTLQAPLGQLERALIDEFLRSRGYDPLALGRLSELERHALLAEASLYASARLTEVESKARFLHELHGSRGAEDDAH